MTESQQLSVLNSWFAAHDGRLPYYPEECEEFVDSTNCHVEASPEGLIPSREELLSYLWSEIL